ncbi:MAG: helix-turn-helix domain-containing protein [Clostridiales Family XIII bacterium]|nr:helix-turn-helix domain-containing protein [Clostridiales Family XIII bacterium]
MNTNASATIGKNIRKYREARHLTREQLAEAIGLDTGYLGMCERGERQLGLNKTIEVIDYFGITANDIIPAKTESINRYHEEYITELNNMLDNLSDNQLAAVMRIVESIRTLR